MAKHSIWKSWPKNRTEVTIADGKKTGECVMKWAILLLVVAKRVVVVMSVNEEPIHPPVVILYAATIVRMVWIRMTTASEVAGEVVSRMRHSTGVRKDQSSLSTIRAGNPTKEMIKTTILHHHYHDVVNA